MQIFFTKEDILALNWIKNPNCQERGGIYCVVNRESRELLYVGQAANLKYRLYPSVHPVYRREKHDVYVLFEDSKTERQQMEGCFIQLLKPPRNIRNGTMPNLSDDLVDEYYCHIFN